MEINKTMDFIQTVYSTRSISHSIILYNSKTDLTSEELNNLYDKLIELDFPVMIMNEPLFTPDNISTNELRYRMFFIDQEYFEKFIINKQYDLSNISVIFCLSEETLEQAYSILNKSMMHKNIKSLHLFSC